MKIIQGEVFKKINGFKDYEISNFGRCIIAKTMQIKKHNIHINSGYHSVGLFSVDGKMYRKQVHLLVAEHFLPNPNNYQYVKHLDGDLSNNHVDNLQWISDTEHLQMRKTPKNTSGNRGVCWNKSQKKWHASITFNRKKYHIGSFCTIEEAVEARKKKELELMEKPEQ